jgi:hypothetical protein
VAAGLADVRRDVAHAVARPLRPRKRDRVLAAAEVLGVPLVAHRELAAAAREHGLPLPEALRPPANV